MSAIGDEMEVKKKVEGGCYQQQQQQHQHQMFHIKVQNECGMCVRVCVSVGVCALSSPFSELSTLHGNST